MSVAKQEIDISLVKRFSPLDELDHDKLAELAAKSSVLQFTKGDTVSSKMAKNAMIFLLAGTVDRAAGTAEAETIKAKTDRARRAVFSPNDRTRVIAKSDVTVLCIDSDLLDLLRNWGDSGGGMDTGIVVDEIESSSGDWVDGLMRSDVVTNLSPSSIQALMAAIEPVDFNADQIIFHQGDAPDYYYIVSRGRCVVTRRDPGLDTVVELASLGPGGAFGEEALITDAPRNATVRMTEKGIVLRLSRGEFKKMLEQPLVRTIGGGEVNSLKAKGAMMLYIHAANDLAQSAEGLNVSMAQLRERMNELNKGRSYIVLSDNDKLSAAGAFLLSQKGFNVCVIKGTEKIEPVAEPPKPSSRPVAALQSTAAEIEKELEEIKAKLREEQQNHAAAQDRVRVLETDLKTTRAGAKAAINAAGELKSRTEALLRQQIDGLNTALKREQNSSKALTSENSRLNEQLTATQSELQLSRQHAETLAQESQAREVELNGTINQFQETLEEQTKSFQLLQGDYQLLQNQHVQLEVKHKRLIEEKDSLQQQYADLDKRFEQLTETNQSLQQQHSALEADFEKLTDEKQLLAAKLDEANQHLQRRAELISSLQDELKSITARAESTEQSLATLKGQHTELETRYEQGQQQIFELDKTRSELYFRVQTLTKESQDQARAAAEQRETLEGKIKTLNDTLEETKAAFSKSEADYKQKISKLSADLKGAKQEITRLTELSTKQDTDIKTLTVDLDALKAAHKRRGIKIAILTVLVLLTGAGVAASLMGIDLRSAAIALINQAAKFHVKG